MHCRGIKSSASQQLFCVNPSSSSPLLLYSPSVLVLYEEQGPHPWWTWLKLLMAWQVKRIAQAQPGQGTTGRQHHGNPGEQGKPVPKWMKLGKK